jgi:glycosyltransferase involved in cell wall biosynthesis
LAEILLITRKFPPSTGGMEKAAYELYRHLSQITEVKLAKWGGSNRWLPVVLPYLFFKALWILLFNKVSVIYLQDGLLAPLGYLLKVSKKPVVTTIHGLDITYKNRFYQLLTPKCVKRLDKVICISNAAKEECLKRSIPEEKIVVIPVGVSDEFYMNLECVDRHRLREKVSVRLGFNLNNKKILLSVGRLTERKGFHWFVENVLSKIIEGNKDCIYLIAGKGVYQGKIREATERRSLKNHVFMLGQVDSEMLRYLYNVADVYVMPNVRVKGDIEGFGLVALEAASCGLPVVASKLEGIEDAIKNGENGFLVDYNDIRGFVDTITKLLANDEEREKLGKRAREFSLENYHWGKIARRYLEELSGMQGSQKESRDEHALTL